MDLGRKYMVKIFLDKRKIKKADKKYILESINEYLEENNLCYVLLTCSSPSKEGNMQVEMSYGGDDYLASYLIESAQEVVKIRESQSN
jgi:hypothetical protein